MVLELRFDPKWIDVLLSCYIQNTMGNPSIFFIRESFDGYDTDRIKSKTVNRVFIDEMWCKFMQAL